MKYPPPHPPEAQKDRLGNAIPPSSKVPFAVGLWIAVMMGIVAGLTANFIREKGHIHGDFLQRALGGIFSVGLFSLLNRGLDCFAWYRSFKRSRALNNGANILLVIFILFLCALLAMGSMK